MCRHAGQLSQAPDCLSAQLYSFMSAVADESLTILLSLLPTAPVNMVGPSSSTKNVLQEELDHFNNMAGQELRKGALCDKELVAQYEKRVENLFAQIKQASGEAQHHGAVLL